MATKALTPQVPGDTPAADAPATAPTEATTGGTPNAADQAAAAPEPLTPAPAASGELPDEKDIDHATIKQAVLTKQGWVVPHPPVKEK